jgi:hypothetical protein
MQWLSSLSSMKKPASSSSASLRAKSRSHSVPHFSNLKASEQPKETSGGEEATAASTTSSNKTNLNEDEIAETNSAYEGLREPTMTTSGVNSDRAASSSSSDSATSDEEQSSAQLACPDSSDYFSQTTTNETPNASGETPFLENITDDEKRRHMASSSIRGNLINNGYYY